MKRLEKTRGEEDKEESKLRGWSMDGDRGGGGEKRKRRDWSMEYGWREREGKMRASKKTGVRMERERGKDERKQRDWSSDGEREGKMRASKEIGVRMERERER
jgi:hypothetical protein